MSGSRETYCIMTGIHHSTITTRGCPHCCTDLRLEEGLIKPRSERKVSIAQNKPNPTIKQKQIKVENTSKSFGSMAIDLTGSPTRKKRFDSYQANRGIIESSRQSSFRSIAGKGGLKVTAKANSSIVPEVPVKDIAETRPVTVIVGPYMGHYKEYKNIGLSTYTFNNCHQTVPDWQNFIREYILPNHSQWEDFGYHRMTTTSIKRYLIATQWSITRGPTVLGKRERGVTTISQFLSFFPSSQSIIYIIVELVVEECGQDGLLSPRQKEMIKVEAADTYTTDTIANNNVIVKPEVYSEMQQKTTDILDTTRGDSIADLIKIKSERVEQTLKHTRNDRKRLFQTTPPGQMIPLGWPQNSPTSPVSKRLRRRREMKDASIICPLEQVESNTQSFGGDCLSFGSLHEEEQEYQSSNYERSASSDDI